MILICPMCDSENVTVSNIDMEMVNTGQFYCSLMFP